MTYGLTSTGFNAKPQSALEDELRAALRASLGPELNLSAESVLGQLTTIYAASLAELWQVAASVHRTFYPDSAAGAALDALAALTGTTRRPATRSTVTATVNLDAGTTLPAGSVASVAANAAARFRTKAAVANGGAVAADVAVEMEAEETGPVAAPTGTLTVIETPVVGWNSVTNATDADLGELEETDAELRVRRASEIRRTGSATVEAIRVDLLDVADVEAVRVFENDTDTEDAAGLPPHSIEAVVLEGADQAVADALWATKGAGVATHGSTAVLVTDGQGDAHTVRFSRPTEVLVYLDVHVTTDADYPATGDDQIKAALAAYGQTLSIGDDLIRARLFEEILDVAGVVDVTTLLVDTVTPPVAGGNVAATDRQIIDIDTARITVTS